jgi:enduracididine biosynthesis enzyme MppR
MIPPPPWHFSGECLWIDCRMDGAAVEAFLPEGLEPDPDDGRAAVAFYDWQWCSHSREELLDPRRAQFKECVIVLGCRLGDRSVARIPYAWVDDAVPLVRGFIQGLPKLAGSIWITKGVQAGLGGPRRTAGGVFAATASANGRLLAEAAVTLVEPVADPPELSMREIVHTRRFPKWDPAGGEAVDELVTGTITDAEHSGIWRGAATLHFHDAADPDLASLAPLETEIGYLFSYGETLSPGRVLQSAGG